MSIEQPFQFIIIEVTVLGQGGWQLFGYERACFPMHKVVTRRKKHVMYPFISYDPAFCKGIKGSELYI
jgi:hypothetical protein